MGIVWSFARSTTKESDDAELLLTLVTVVSRVPVIVLEGIGPRTGDSAAT